ncbi:putative ABC transporter [Gregarina niphandrodes]|uniref:ABC transporter n=1 Tax=Gregarina niphandrodes TaxID=110365 RepID=A0A023AZQ4_GRENI|nr:putative ABC transporter [Gregarina niphandrodes]EZG43790.1 putative ABC transporter [Gregarina niphandrodes]|eukprot:XP_011134600.1 putative ABC transporter [Gregarina niphandrodes]
MADETDILAIGSPPATSPSSQTITLWAENIHYKVVDKTIIDNVTVRCRSGDLTVMLGPSGSGKTTLLNVLAGRLRTFDEGSAGINNKVITDSISKYLINYVMATDRLNEFLTVYETLLQTAQLKLPHKSYEECQVVVEKLLVELRLVECRDTLIGGVWRKGISKGQMKRVCIAQELIGDPLALILDEPTTGLDSSLSYELIQILSNVAKERDIIVLCTLHQPNQRMFDVFDQLIIMAEGRVLYQGPAKAAFGYFVSQGAITDPDAQFDSVPDILLEVACNIQRDDGGNNDEEGMRHGCHASCRSLKWQVKTWTRRYHHAGATQNERYEELPGMDKIQTITDAQSWTAQYRIVFMKYLKTNCRNPLTIMIILLTNIVQAILLGCLFFQMESDVKTVTTRPFNEWSIFQTPMLYYLDNGLTNDTAHKVDPLRDMMVGGIDGQGTSMVFDIMANPDMVQWLFDFIKCFRSNIPYDTSGYPRWNFVDPDDSTTTSTPIISTTSSSSSSSKVGFLDIGLDQCWNWENAYEDTTFGGWSLEQGVTAGTAILQIIDSVMANDAAKDWPDFQADRENLLPFWYSVQTKMAPYGNTGLCCAGDPFGFAAMGGVVCSNVLGDYPQPTFPGHMYWPENAGQKVIQFLQQKPVLDTVAMVVSRVHSDVEALAAKRRLQQDNYGGKFGGDKYHEFGGERYHEFGGDKYHEFGGDKYHEFGGDKYHEFGEASLRETGSRIGDAMKAVARSAPKRALGSGLGGMVTDLVDLIIGNPGSPLYQVMVAFAGIIDRLSAKNCGTVYCEYLRELWSTGEKTLNDLSSTILTVLNLCGTIFFLCANLGFSSYDVLLQFPKDRAIFNRERANGMYRTSSFLMGKMAAEMPFHILPGITWSVIYFFMVGLDSSGWRVPQYIGVAALISFTAYSMGYCVSSVVLRLETSIVFSPLVLVVMLVLAGFFMRDSEFPAWVNWAKYLSIYRWAYFAVTLINFPPHGTFGAIPNSLALILAGVTDTVLYHSCLYMLCISLVCRIACYFGLKYLHTTQGIEA